MEFGAVLKELTYKSVCLFFIFSYSFFAVACVAQHEEDKAIAVSEMCIYNHRTTKTNQKYPSVNL